MLFMRAKTHQQDLESYRRAESIDGHQVELLWVECAVCHEQFFGNKNSAEFLNMSPGEVRRDFDLAVARVRTTLEKECPKHGDMVWGIEPESKDDE